MAGEWIKMRWCLASEPEVLQMSDDLALPVQHILGCLFQFWAWADQHLALRNGDAAGVTKKRVDALVDTPGFAEALEKVGWLQSSHAGVEVPKYDVHLGQRAKGKALTADRNRLYREKKTRRKRDDSIVTRSSSSSSSKKEGGGGGENTPCALPGPAGKVLDHYRSYHPRGGGCDDCLELVADRLAEGFSADDLIAAIDGCHRSPFHCGENPQGMIYQSLGLILRDADHVEQFRGLAKPARRPAPASPESAVLSAVRRIRRAKPGIDDDGIVAELQRMKLDTKLWKSENAT